MAIRNIRVLGDEILRKKGKRNYRGYTENSGIN